MVGKLVKWFLFSVVVAMLPLAFAWVSSYMAVIPKAYADVVGRGELFIVSGAICAAAIGDLIGKAHANQKTTIVAYVAGGAAVTILMMCSLLYANATSGNATQSAAIAAISSWFYFASVVTGATGIVLGEM